MTTRTQMEPLPQNDNLQPSAGLATLRPGKGCWAGSREERHECPQDETQSVQIWASQAANLLSEDASSLSCVPGHYGV